MLSIMSVFTLAGQPSDKDSILKMGVGTKLSVIQNIYIPSFEKGDWSFEGNTKFDFASRTCTFIISKSENQRLIPEGTEYTITKIYRDWHQDAVFILLDSENIKYIQCNLDEYAPPSIGTFKKISAQYLSIALADIAPEIIR